MQTVPSGYTEHIHPFKRHTRARQDQRQSGGEKKKKNEWPEILREAAKKGDHTIGVIHLGGELHLGGHLGVILGEGQFGLEQSSLATTTKEIRRQSKKSSIK